MFTSVGSLVNTLPKRSKTAAPLLALMVRQVARDQFMKIMPDLNGEILESVKVSAFKNGVLLVMAPGLVCTELKMRSGALIDAINKTIGKKVVFKIRFKVE